MLTIYIDFKSAASYLALTPTLNMIEETGVQTRWLPFSSRPFSIPQEKPDETVGERHRRVRAIAQRDAHLHYAGVQGLDMRLTDRPAGSDAALAALAALEGDPVPIIRSAFKAYWSDQMDLDDRACVTQILNDCGHGEPDWDDAYASLDKIRDEALEQKLFETPTYMIDGQIFLGREHLPWIRSLLP